jgi:hypothetical protein
MSGFPALRCFIFFAADLFIPILPSFRREPPQRWIRDQPLHIAYILLEVAGRDEFVPHYWILCA